VILELLEYWITPASRLARKLGFLRSSLQVRSRYLRCRDAWESHLQNTRSAILSALESCKSRRTVVILGGGLVHDIPLAPLCAAFEKVLLVDAVHTLHARFHTRQFSNVERLTVDITGCADQLLASRTSGVPLPKIVPRLLLEDGRVDLTISVNVLSQLGWIPGQILEGYRSEEEIDAFKSQLIRAHLAYLRQVPGRSVLITDHAWSRFPAGGDRRHALSHWSVLQEVRLPKADRCWDWDIAPAPEKEPGVDWVAHAVFFADWKTCSEGADWP
jgi:hypothetical protein